jgi:hypothetical protein
MGPNGAREIIQTHRLTPVVYHLLAEGVDGKKHILFTNAVKSARCQINQKLCTNYTLFHKNIPE